jgi:hypothetical protein
MYNIYLYLFLFQVEVSSVVKFSTSYLFHVSGQYTLSIQLHVRRTSEENVVCKCYKIQLIVDEEDR